MSNRSTASFHIELAGHHMSFRIMPAWICKQCGETYFETYSEEHEVNFIQSAVDSRDRQDRRLLARA